jgi:ABC-type amino acid transport substrate-binding protein
MAAGQLDAEEASTMDQNLHKLLLGRIDAFASNVLSVRYVIKGTPMAQETELLPHLLQANRPAYVVVSRNVSLPDRDRVIGRLARALASLQADGTYKRIVAHYEE